MFYKYIKKLNTFHISQKQNTLFSFYATKYNSLILKVPVYSHIFFVNRPVFSPFLFCGIQQNPYICIAFEKIP